ncbi:MAG: hypothetical protein L6U99_13670 [Clostridium sp.]|nr:MAG: hypothetical protein L6U99_13670 [Clostridium sp.]
MPAGLTGWQFIKMMQDLQGIHNEEMLHRMLNKFELYDNVLSGDTKRMSLGVKKESLQLLQHLCQTQMF